MYLSIGPFVMSCWVSVRVRVRVSVGARVRVRVRVSVGARVRARVRVRVRARVKVRARAKFIFPSFLPSCPGSFFSSYMRWPWRTEGMFCLCCFIVVPLESWDRPTFCVCVCGLVVLVGRQTDLCVCFARVMLLDGCGAAHTHTQHTHTQHTHNTHNKNGCRQSWIGMGPNVVLYIG
jgi:hypothetical protein